MKPLLAHVYEPHRVQYPCFIQPKLNGIRALYQNGYFQSRDGQIFSVGLLEHLIESLVEIFDEVTVLDGELYVHGWPLQRINGAVTPVRQQPNADTLQVEYHIFDRPHRLLSFYDRMELVREKEALLQDTKIRRVITCKVGSEQAADLSYARFVTEGYEGMMYRLGDCPYTIPKQQKGHYVSYARTLNIRARLLSDKDNRVWHLLKRKDWQDGEFECVGVEEGKDKYMSMVGALRCLRNANPSYNGPSSFTVSGGLTDSDRAKFFDHPELIIGKQIKVKYLCLSQDQIPLNPTILCILP